jgi:hypothetical protein
MSYIRALSNPESLYIYSDGSEIIIHEGCKQTVKAPIEEFNHLLYCWAERQEFEGETLEVNCGMDNKYKITLRSLDGWSIEMYESTWEFIVNRNAWRDGV